MTRQVVLLPAPLASRAGTYGWVALAAGVIIWDAMAPETLSAAFWRAHQHPASRIAVGAAWALLTGHLFGVLGTADPFRRENAIQAVALARRTCSGRGVLVLRSRPLG